MNLRRIAAVPAVALGLSVGAALAGAASASAATSPPYDPDQAATLVVVKHLFRNGERVDTDDAVAYTARRVLSVDGVPVDLSTEAGYLAAQRIRVHDVVELDEGPGGAASGTVTGTPVTEPVALVPDSGVVTQTATFENLPHGVYVVAESDVSGGAPTSETPSVPFVVVVPAFDAVDGRWVHTVVAEPKNEPRLGTEPTDRPTRVPGPGPGSTGDVRSARPPGRQDVTGVTVGMLVAALALSVGAAGVAAYLFVSREPGKDTDV